MDSQTIAQILQANGGKMTGSASGTSGKSSAQITSILQANGGKKITSQSQDSAQNQPGFWQSLYQGIANPIAQTVGTGVKAAQGLAGLGTAAAGKVIGNQGLEQTGLDIAESATKDKTMDLSSIGLSSNLPTLGYNDKGQKLSTGQGSPSRLWNSRRSCCSCNRGSKEAFWLSKEALWLICMLTFT